MRNQPHGQGTITGYSEDLTDIIGRMLMVAPRSRPSAEEVDDACTYSQALYKIRHLENIQVSSSCL